MKNAPQFFTIAGKDVSEDQKSGFLFGAEVRRMHFNSSHHAESVHLERARTAIITVILNSSNQLFVSTAVIRCGEIFEMNRGAYHLRRGVITKSIWEATAYLANIGKMNLGFPP